MKWWTFVVILVTAISLASARGGRGGGGRFSSRGRYSSSSTRSYRSSFSGNRLSSSSSIRSALLLGTVYGASRYRQRARFIKDGTLPEICYNDSYNMSTNGTISYQGRFFCPIDENMSEDYRYCCGEEGQQYCCRFWDSPGRVVGVVVGILFGVVAMFVLVFCVIKHFKRERRKPQNNTYTDQTATFNDHAMYPPAYAPPTYEMSNTNGNEKKPYPPNDTGYYSNYGFTPTVLDPQTAPPYPTTTTSNPTANDTYGQKY